VRRAAAGLLIVGIALPGCTLRDDVCTTIGHASIARIALDIPRDGLSLELCEGEGCTPGPSAQPERIGAGDPESVGRLLYNLQGDSARGWEADFIDPPASIGYHLLDPAGVVVAAGSTDVSWARVGGTEECGGPLHVEIELPA